MDTLRATFRIVTPMFLGGAWSQELASTIRPPSVKGALRFWWRALQWNTCLKEKSNNEAEALKLLHEREGRLFGTAADEQRGQQARVHLRIQSSSLQRSTPTDLNIEYSLNRVVNNQTQAAWQSYLIGLGLCKYDRNVGSFVYTRGAIIQGTFTAFLLIAPSSPAWSGTAREQDIESLTQALSVFGLLGGLGSRTRRGLGSVSLTEVSYPGSQLNIPKDREEWIIAVNNLLVNAAADEEPPFTAFSKLTTVKVGPLGHSSWDVLGDVGKEMQLYRSWGRNDGGGQHVVNEVPAEQNFCNDHQRGEAIALGTTCQFHPRRIIFGLPHAYYFSGGTGQSRMTPGGEKRQRRGSPLFIHVHQCPNGETFAVQSLFRARYLPNDEKIAMARKVGDVWSVVESVTVKPDWTVYDEYFNRPYFASPAWETLP